METTTVKQRKATVVSDRHLLNMMGLPVWEALPALDVPYALSDPFILVHEATLKISPEMAKLDTEHPHRGFDNLWYVLKGTTSTGHTTGPRGSIERARLPEGSLLHLRTGRGVRHAEDIGADELRNGLEGSEMRGVLFWVNLARKDKQVDPTARIVRAEDLAQIQDGDATSRILVGEGSAVRLGTPAIILDVVLEHGGHAAHNVPSEFQGFAYLLEGAASFGANRAQGEEGQLVLMGPGEDFAVDNAKPGTMYLLMAGKPYGEKPRFNGPYVD